MKPELVGFLVLVVLAIIKLCVACYWAGRERGAELEAERDRVA